MENTQFCFMELIKKTDHHETHNVHPHTGRFYPLQLFTVQSRNNPLLKYAVHLFHWEIINVSTVCK